MVNRTRVFQIVAGLLICLGLYTAFKWSADFIELSDQRNGARLIRDFKASYKERFLRAAQREAESEEVFNDLIRSGVEPYADIQLSEIDMSDPFENPTLINPDIPPYSVTWKVVKVFDAVYAGQLKARWTGLPVKTRQYRLDVEVIETYTFSYDDLSSFYGNLPTTAGWKLAHTSIHLSD